MIADFPPYPLDFPSRFRAMELAGCVWPNPILKNEVLDSQLTGLAPEVHDNTAGVSRSSRDESTPSTQTQEDV